MFDHDPTKIRVTDGCLRAAVAIRAGVWLGTLDGYLAGNRPECEVLLSTSMVRQLRSCPFIVYREDGMYHWPMLSVWAALVPGIPPNVGIKHQLDVVAIRPIKQGEPLSYDPATVIPEGSLGPDLDGSPRYYAAMTDVERTAARPYISWSIRREYGGETPPSITVLCQDPAEERAARPYISWSIRREYGGETPPSITVLCQDPAEERAARALIDPAVPTSAPSPEYMTIYPGTPDRYSTSSSARLKATTAELRDRPAVCVGSATAQLLGLRNRAYFSWNRASPGSHDLRARLPDTTDPAWATEPFGRSLRDFFTAPPSPAGTQGGTRFSRITSRTFPRPEGMD